MAKFDLSYFSVSSGGQLAVLGQNPGGIQLDSKWILVNSKIRATVGQGECYYLGYIQVCYRNNQVNHYGPHVEQKWEFNHGIVSDSAASDERPWYGSFREPSFAGFRRRILHPARNVQTVQFSMTDFFRPTSGKLETLPTNQPGPEALTRIVRDQRFRLWLVAVPTSVLPDDPDGPGKYIRLAEVDWHSQYDVTVVVAPLSPHNATIHITTDILTTKIVYNSHGCGGLNLPSESGGNAIPTAAMTAPIANENQELSRYVNHAQTNIIVHRTA